MKKKVEGILLQYNKFVKKAHDEYIKPCMSYADIIVPGQNDNKV